jgi:hypothetical protein
MDIAPVFIWLSVSFINFFAVTQKITILSADRQESHGQYKG